jgi:thiol-disulfide isomerase/thioredoxin
MGNNQIKGGTLSDELVGGKFLKDIQLNDSHFELKNGRVYLKDKKTTGLIAFYAPWCGYCVQLAPEWNRYAKQSNSTSFKFMAVDCTDDKCSDIVRTLNIQGYPTIKYVDPVTHEVVSTDKPDGSRFNRTKEGIKAFLKDKRVI